MQTFAAWSALHAIAIAAIAILWAAAIAWRRRASESAAIRAERCLALAYLAFWVATFVRLPTRPDFDPSTDYPLQLCHWTAVACALALGWPSRPLRAIAYFWGLALCTQALVTPNLTEGPAHWPFWFFWTTHALCAGMPVYDAVARGFRPRWSDYVRASVAAATYVAVTLAIDLATGWNYGFVGPSRPNVATLVDLLGPWPERLLAIGAIAAVAMALLMLPWVVGPALTRTREPSRPVRRA